MFFKDTAKDLTREFYKEVKFRNNLNKPQRKINVWTKLVLSLTILDIIFCIAIFSSPSLEIKLHSWVYYDILGNKRP